MNNPEADKREKNAFDGGNADPRDDNTWDFDHCSAMAERLYVFVV